jgi:hypothetical protein
MVAGVIWTPLICWVIWALPGGDDPGVSESTERLAMVSFVYPVFYFGASWAISVRHWRKRAAHP